MDYKEIKPDMAVNATTKKGNTIHAKIVGMVPNSFTMVNLIEIGESKPKSHRSKNGNSWQAGTFIAGDEYIIHRNQITSRQ